MGMTNRPRSGPPTPQVNVTPLVDVALVVLIIFMVVTPLMTKTMPLHLPPKPDASQPKPPRPADAPPPVVMTVAADGTIAINDRPIDPTTIGSELPRMLAAQPKPVLFFDASDRAEYGAAVAALDLARASGARAIAILTKNVADD